MLEQNFKQTAERVIPKIALALLISLLLHGVIIFNVKIQRAMSGGALYPVIEARLVSAAPARERMIALDPSPSANKHSDGIKPVAPETPFVPKPLAEATPAPSPPLPVSGEHSILPALDIPLAEDPTYYPAKQLDVHPVTLHPISPQYPQSAEENNVAGEVTLLLLIDEFGVVREISVVEAKPEGYFEEAAMAVFRAARFSPAQKQGHPVKSRVTLQVKYLYGESAGATR